MILPNTDKCKECGGDGNYEPMRNSAGLAIEFPQKCTHCKGSGQELQPKELNGVEHIAATRAGFDAAQNAKVYYQNPYPPWEALLRCAWADAWKEGNR